MPARLRDVVLVGLGACVLGALVLLAVGVNREPSFDIDEAALAQARATHQRSETQRALRATPVPRRRPPRSRPAEDDATPGDGLWKAARRRPLLHAPVRPSIPQPAPAPAAEVSEPGTAPFVQAMDDANHLYDRGDYIGALDAAEVLLGAQPNNVRMLRIAVSSNCILGNADEAIAYGKKLPARDRRQLARRCERFGVNLVDPEG